MGLATGNKHLAAHQHALDDLFVEVAVHPEVTLIGVVLKETKETP